MDNNTNRFYVYALLDPRKKGSYCYPYIPISFLYEPFYIGKGQTTRAYAHFGEKIEKTANPFKVNKMSKILKETGKKPFLIKIIENLENKDALETEILLIKNIGRGKLGPLTNLTDGGEGMIGYKHTERAIELIKESNKRRVVTEETKKKISIGVKTSGFKFTPEMKEKMSKNTSGNKNFFFGKRFCGIENHMFGKHLSEEQKMILKKAAKSRTGLKNPNNRYSYCLFNSETKEQFHNVSYIFPIIGENIRPLTRKAPNARRFKKWLIIRELKELVKKCACKDILTHPIFDLPMGKKTLKDYIKKNESDC